MWQPRSKIILDFPFSWNNDRMHLNSIARSGRVPIRASVQFQESGMYPRSIVANKKGRTRVILIVILFSVETTVHGTRLIKRNRREKGSRRQYEGILMVHRQLIKLEDTHWNNVTSEQWNSLRTELLHICGTNTMPGVNEMKFYKACVIHGIVPMKMAP